MRGWRGTVAALGSLVVLAACDQAARAPTPDPPTSVPTRIPAYDGSLPPAEAVQALVPLRARTIRLTYFAQIRRAVGLPEVDSRSSAADRATFWSRARLDAPVLDRPVLLSKDASLRTTYGFGVDDEVWEAHFDGGGVHGWVVSLRADVDMSAVLRAVRAGVGPLQGATVNAADHLVTQGIAARGEAVWGSDLTWGRLLPEPGEAYVVRRGCVGSATTTQAELEPLSGFAVTFGDHVATVRVDPDRDDLFVRARLGDRAFRHAFPSPVADPSSGRIGYDVPDPAQAAALVREGVLPFGACG